MHEEALLHDLRRKIQEVGAANGEVRITRVTLWVGALAHLSEPTVRERWPDLAAGTRAEGAQLEIERSADLNDPRATGVVLVSVAVDGPPDGGEPPRSPAL